MSVDAELAGIQLSSNGMRGGLAAVADGRLKDIMIFLRYESSDMCRYRK